MDSRRLAYLYLPSIAIILCVIATVLDVNAGHEVRISVIILIPLMAALIGIGIKNKVWRD